VGKFPFLAFTIVKIRCSASEPSGFVLDTSFLVGNPPLSLSLFQLQFGSFSSWNVAFFQQTLIRTEAAVS
jgi:hypothetical protein